MFIWCPDRRNLRHPWGRGLPRISPHTTFVPELRLWAVAELNTFDSILRTFPSDATGLCEIAIPLAVEQSIFRTEALHFFSLLQHAIKVHRTFYRCFRVFRVGGSLWCCRFTTEQPIALVHPDISYKYIDEMMTCAVKDCITPLISFGFHSVLLRSQLRNYTPSESRNSYGTIRICTTLSCCSPIGTRYTIIVRHDQKEVGDPLILINELPIYVLNSGRKICI